MFSTFRIHPGFLTETLLFLGGHKLMTKHSGCMLQTVCLCLHPTNSYVKALTHNMMVLRSEYLCLLQIHMLQY